MSLCLKTIQNRPFEGRLSYLAPEFKAYYTFGGLGIYDYFTEKSGSPTSSYEMKLKPVLAPKLNFPFFLFVYITLLSLLIRHKRLQQDP